MPAAALLPIGIRRTLFRSMVRSAMMRGISANQAIHEARKLGVGYRRAIMLADWREVTGIVKKADTFRFIPRKFLPPKHLFEKTNFAIRRNYHYVYRMRILNKITGELEEVHRSIATDRILTIRQATQIIEELVVDPIKIFYTEEYEVISYELYAVREKKK